MQMLGDRLTLSSTIVVVLGLMLWLHHERPWGPSLQATFTDQAGQNRWRGAPRGTFDIEEIIKSHAVFWSSQAEEDRYHVADRVYPFSK